MFSLLLIKRVSDKPYLFLWNMNKHVHIFHSGKEQEIKNEHEACKRESLLSSHYDSDDSVSCYNEI